MAEGPEPHRGLVNFTDIDEFFDDRDPAKYAAGRFPWRTYLSKSFPIRSQHSRDFGQPARFISKVFDVGEVLACSHSASEELVVMSSPTGRVQLKLLVAREASKVKELWIERVRTYSDGSVKLEPILNLKRDEAMRLVGLLANLHQFDVEGPRTVRIDDSLLDEVLADPEAVSTAYERNREQFRELIAQDESARDLIALASRRERLAYFRELLDDESLFADQQARLGGSEKVWQAFFEENPWMLGVGLSTQLMTSWNAAKLEQVVSGFDISGAGKRTDALLRTAGGIRHMAFAEIKHHMTPLLAARPYRPACWSPSSELSGGVVQVQQTVYLATSQIGESLDDLATDGSTTGQETFLHRPRSFLVIGRSTEMRGEFGGVNKDKNRSFEIYRRNLYEPEILTFDEVLARAEWQVELAARLE